MIALADLEKSYGTTVRITGLAKHLSKYLEKITLLAPTVNDDLLSIKSIEHVAYCGSQKAKILFLINPFFLGAPIPLGMSANLMANKKLFSTRSDILHCYEPWSLPLALSIKRRLGTPILFDPLGVFELFPPGQTKSNLLKIHHSMTVQAEKVAFQSDQVDAMCFASESLKSYVVNRFRVPAERIFVIPDGIDPDSLKLLPSEEKVSKLKRLLDIENKKVVAYVGDLAFACGFIDLLKAIKIIEKSHESKDLIFLLIVTSKRRGLEYVKDLGIKKFRMVENVPHNKLFNYLELADVLIVPHRQGTWYDYVHSNKLLDYVVTGKPIVATALPSIVEFLKNYKGARILVEPNNTASLAQGILRVLNDNSFGRTMSQTDREQMISEFSWTNSAKKAIQVYETLLN